jgi:uncharacterized membrane protein
MRLVNVLLLLSCVAVAPVLAQGPANIHVEVRFDSTPVAEATVLVNGVAYLTAADGSVSLSVSAGPIEITVVKEGFASAITRVTLGAGQTQQVLVDLQPQPSIEEQITVSATRTDRRLEDLPIRV